MNDYFLNLIASVNPRKIWEIGVGNINICRTIRFFNTKLELSLFEVNPKTFEQIAGVLEQHKISNVKLYNVGVYDKTGTIEFNDDGDSTASAEVFSPRSLAETKKELPELPKIVCPVIDMAEIDPGDIDVVLIDTEGCEYKIISRMKSRPKIIVVETHNDDKSYLTPNFDLLEKWLSENGYIKLLEDVTDTWYVRVEYTKPIPTTELRSK
jgi:FkbM family methyltransferase